MNPELDLNLKRQETYMKLLSNRELEHEKRVEWKNELLKLRERARVLMWMEIKEGEFKDPDSIPELPGKISEEEWNVVFRPALIRGGAIPKEELEISETYIGSCRNASRATWDGEKFIYTRYKFGNTFEDDVPHFDDAWNTSEDCFIPIQKV